MKQIISFRVAAIIYALAIAAFGILHFMSAGEMKTMLPDYIPGGAAIVYFTGACLLAAAIAIIIEKQTRLACYLLAVMLLIFGFTLHLRPSFTTTFALFLKDAAMAMAAIMIGNNSSK
jgi:putative oxidoreductase